MGLILSCIPERFTGCSAITGRANRLCSKFWLGAGAARPDSGDLSIDGKAIALSSPRDALDQGIGCVYQELRQIPDLTVTENLFLGREERCYGLKNGGGRTGTC